MTVIKIMLSPQFTDYVFNEQIAKTKLMRDFVYDK